MPRTTLASTALAGAIASPLIAGAIASLAWAGAAYAAPPQSLPAPTASPSTVVPGGELVIAGGGCIGTGGTPGVVTLTLQNPDGTVLADQVTDLDANGRWAAQYSAPDAAAAYTVIATCDLYGSTLGYPPVVVTVTADGGSAPPVGAELDESAASGQEGAPGGDGPGGAGDSDAVDDAAPAADGAAPTVDGSTALPREDLSTTGSHLSDAGLVAGGLLVGGLTAVYAGRRRGSSP